MGLISRSSGRNRVTRASAPCLNKQAPPQPESNGSLKAIHFSHDADIGVCGVGPTLEAAFEQAALAMTAVMTDPAKIELKEAVQIECDAPNVEFLLVDWLNAIVFEDCHARHDF